MPVVGDLGAFYSSFEGGVGKDAHKKYNKLLNGTVTSHDKPAHVQRLGGDATAVRRARVGDQGHAHRGADARGGGAPGRRGGEADGR